LKEGRREATRALAELLVNVARDAGVDSSTACIPIPSSQIKLVERGFNPVQIVLDEAARLAPDVIRVSNSLVHIKATRDSVGLNVHDRRLNVQNAFSVSGGVPPTVVLIDDVLTTGATLESAAAVLANAGAKEIFAIVLCGSRPQGLR